MVIMLGPSLILWGWGWFPHRQLSGTSVWRPQSRYTMSRIECRIKFPQNQRCRAKIALHPPKSRCRTFLRNPPPPSHFPLFRSRQGAKGGCRGGLVEGVASLLGSENLSGLKNANAKRCVFERKGPERKPCPRGKSLNRKKTIAMRFSNSSVLECISLNRNLSWGFPLLETGIGGVKSSKIRGGVKILNFQGPLNLTLSYRDSIENRQFGGQKSKFSRGNFRGEFPPL